MENNELMVPILEGKEVIGYAVLNRKKLPQAESWVLYPENNVDTKEVGSLVVAYE